MCESEEPCYRRGGGPPEYKGADGEVHRPQYVEEQEKKRPKSADPEKKAPITIRERNCNESLKREGNK